MLKGNFSRKNLVLLMMALGFNQFHSVGANATVIREEKPDSVAAQALGDDLIPWPWGTECPFPWAEIEGKYTVKRFKDGAYSRHVLNFEVNRTQSEGVSYLDITDYNEDGKIFAIGKGYALKDQRLVRGILEPISGGKKYSIIVRSYVRHDFATCTDKDLLTVVTFCPLRGKRCKEDSNYELVPANISELDK